VHVSTNAQVQILRGGFQPVNDLSRKTNQPRNSSLNSQQGSLRGTPRAPWPYRQSITILRRILGGRMYPLTLDGLTKAMRRLSTTAREGVA
jgi:hypothetical protein